MANDPAQLRQMDPAQLDKEEEALRSQLWKLRLNRTTGQLQDPQKVKIARRDLARVLTVKRERELAGKRS